MELTAILINDDFWVSQLSNTVALLLHEYFQDRQVNWLGFCLLRNHELILGPFQGKLACSRIEVRKGVCGTAALTRVSQLVPNVLEFPGRISCDSVTQSELVVPVFDDNGELKGVLDIDCLVRDGLTMKDKELMEHLMVEVGRHVHWPKCFM